MRGKNTRLAATPEKKTPRLATRASLERLSSDLLLPTQRESRKQALGLLLQLPQLAQSPRCPRLWALSVASQRPRGPRRPRRARRHRQRALGRAPAVPSAVVVGVLLLWLLLPMQIQPAAAGRGVLRDVEQAAAPADCRDRVARRQRHPQERELAAVLLLAAGCRVGASAAAAAAARASISSSFSRVADFKGMTFGPHSSSSPRSPLSLTTSPDRGRMASQLPGAGAGGVDAIGGGWSKIARARV